MAVNKEKHSVKAAMAASKIKEALKQFALSTSMKGIGPALKSEFITLKIIWSTATVIFVECALYETYGQVVQISCCCVIT